MSENRRWSKVHPNDPGENSELVDCFHFSHWQEKTSPGLEESLPTKRHQCFAKMNKGTIIMISQVMYRNQVKYVSDPSNLTYFDMFLPWNQQIWGEKWSMDIDEGAFSIGLVDSRRNQLEGVKTYQNLHQNLHQNLYLVGLPSTNPSYFRVNLHGIPWLLTCFDLHLQQDVRDAVSRARVKTLKETELQVFVAGFRCGWSQKDGGISPFGDGDSTDSMGYGFVGFHQQSDGE